jgi:hydroxyacylglutathione hydrolase
MPQEIKPINLGGLMGFGANCYLVKTGAGRYVLIDTGYSAKRAEVEKGLTEAGCQPGNLELIALTHGHGDHIGNCVYLREKYGAPIAMHRGDSEMVESGIKASLITRIMLDTLSFVFGLGKTERFKPDLYVEDEQDLSAYGFDAKVVHLPGHSKGSIGILTASGDLFCGDLITNKDEPVKHSIVDDPAEFDASVEKLKTLPANTVYPGHGKPFSMEMFVKSAHSSRRTE